MGFAPLAELEVRPFTSALADGAGVRLVRRLIARDPSGARRDGLVWTARIEGPWAAPGEISVPLPALERGEPVVLADLPLRLPPGAVGSGVVAWQVALGAAVFAEGRAPFEARPDDEWLHEDSPPALLACYVRPPGAGFDGDLEAHAAALADRLTDEDPRAGRGVRIRAGAERMNAVELAVHLAGVAEAQRRNVVLAWCGRRLLIGAWSDGFPEGVVTRAARLSAPGLELLDPVALARGGREAGRRAAAEALGELRWALDLAAARADGWGGGARGSPRDRLYQWAEDALALSGRHPLLACAPILVPAEDDGAVKLDARGTRYERAVRGALEQQGEHTAFLALDFLRAPDGRLAPLALAPVSIAAEGGELRYRRAGPARVNPVLAEQLRRHHPVDLLAAALPEDPAALVEAIASRLPAEAGERVQGRGLVRGSLGGVAVARDLLEHRATWEGNTLLQHFLRPAPAFPNPAPATDPASLDVSVATRELPLVLDADGAQAAAIHAALRGRSFALHGAPGTGKSQTIVNLAAAAVGAGRRVLVLARQVTALDVLRRRLHAAGVGRWVLHLARGEDPLDGFVRGRAVADRSFEHAADETDAAKDALAPYPAALHRRHPLGITFREALARAHESREQPTLPLGVRDPLAMTSDAWVAAMAVAARFVEAGTAVEPVRAHPWREWRATDPAAGPAAAQRLRRAEGCLAEVEAAAQALAEALVVPTPTDLRAVADLAAFASGLDRVPSALFDPDVASAAREFAVAVQRWETKSRAVARHWHPSLYGAPELGAMSRAFRRFAPLPSSVRWVFLGGTTRRLHRFVKQELPPTATIASDLQAAVEIEEQREPLLREMQRLRASLGWDGESPKALEELANLADDVAARLARVREAGHPVPDAVLAALDPSAPPDGLRALKLRGNEATRAVERFRAAWKALPDVVRASPPDGALADFAERLATWTAHAERLPEWAAYGAACAELDAAELGAVVEVHRAGMVSAVEVPGLVERSLLREWVESARDADDALRTFRGPERDAQVQRFGVHDAGLAELAVRHIDSRAAAALPRAAEGVDALRRALREAPHLVARFKPIVLATPAQVAELPADGRRFDLLVLEEASRLAACEIIGALGRSQQVVMVGDRHQIPPVRRFTRPGLPPADEDAEERESALDLARAVAMPEVSLGAHYRSRHEDLIRFSHDTFYGRALTLFPAARGVAVDLGVHWHHVGKGRFDPDARTNAVEARLLVDHLLRALVRTPPGQRTFGVVALGSAQRELIADLLDEARAGRPEIAGHFEIDDAVFVRTPDEAQGEERDEVLLSVGLGPDVEGVGRWSRAGSERWVNVAITRARLQLRVFSSVRADEIRGGPAALREFLAFAERVGAAAPAEPTLPDPTPPAFSSPLEQDVGQALHARGWEFETAVGWGRYRIDLAVVHPDYTGQYLLGVELDGPSYVSATTARERDRLRSQLLAARGWRLHRIWSLDWFSDRAGELERLERALAEALGDSMLEPTEPISSVLDEAEVVRGDLKPTAEVEVYRYAELEPVATASAALYDPNRLEDLQLVVQRVLEAEAPMHAAELTRRAGMAFGLTKLTARAQKRVLAVAKLLRRPATVRGAFVWPAGVEPASFDRIRGPAADGEAARAIEHIPPEEIAQAARRVLATRPSLPHADLVRETARIFGIGRVGRKISDGIAAGVQILVERGEVEIQGERVAQR